MISIWPYNAHSADVDGQALNTLIEPDGHTPAVAGFFENVKPLTPAQIKMIQNAAARRSEATVKKQLGVEHCVHDTNWLDSLVLLESKPTINIEGRWQNRSAASRRCEDRYAAGV